MNIEELKETLILYKNRMEQNPSLLSVAGIKLSDQR